MMDGYEDDVSGEMPTGPKEMVLMQKPDFLNKPELKNVIFNSELSNEFVFRYQQQFGYTEQEQNYYLIESQGYYNSPDGVAATQQDAQRQAFAQYMVKRLFEYHADQIMKNDPSFKPIYDVKQKVSNYKVDVGPGSKLDMTYSFVGNFANITYVTPWGTTKANINMDPGSLVPGTPQEELLIFTRPITPTIRYETSYAFVAQTYRFMVEKRLTPTLSTNISETLYLDANVVNVDKPELTLLGLNLAF